MGRDGDGDGAVTGRSGAVMDGLAMQSTSILNLYVIPFVFLLFVLCYDSLCFVCAQSKKRFLFV